MSAKFPTSVATDADLSVAVNGIQTSLSDTITAGATTIPVASVTGLPTAGYVVIDTEVVQYTGISSLTLTGCTRGADSSVAAAHANGTAVNAFAVAAHHNALKDEVEAVESFLDTHLGKSTSTTATEFGYLHGVTSAIQTQINTNTTNISTAQSTANAALPKAGGTMTGQLIVNLANTASAPDIGWTGDTNTGFYRSATHSISVVGNGTETAYFNPNGSGLRGSNTNDAAPAGFVGEFIKSNSSVNNAMPATNTWGDATSISLTAGDWDVSALVRFNANGATLTDWECGISTTSGNSGTGLVNGDNQAINTVSLTASAPMSIPVYRMSLSGTTTVYLKITAIYASGSPVYQYRISARRVR